MRKYKILILLLGVSGFLFGQVKPNLFPIEPNPTNANFEVYSQKNGTNTRASLDAIKGFMAAGVNLTPITYNPSASGNPIANRNSFVIAPDGSVWFIGQTGAALQMGGSGGGSEYEEKATFSGSTYSVTIPIPGVINNRNFEVYRDGVKMLITDDFTISGTIINWVTPYDSEQIYIKSKI